MTRDIERRLQELEAQVPPPPPTEQEKAVKILKNFLICAIAYYLGHPEPGGSVMDAYMRALGYSHSFELEEALNAKDSDFSERAHLATTKLLEKFGVSWEHARDEITEAFHRMEVGLPERYKAVYSRR